MIVSTSLAKVGHRQAPHTKNPIPPKEGWGFYFAAAIMSLMHKTPDKASGVIGAWQIRLETD